MHNEKEFPLFNNKVDGVTKDFNLNDPAVRAEYFQAKAGDAIEKLREYFDNGNTFIAYLLGKKNSGKGTYTKLMGEIFGKELIGHVSIGDLVRSVHADISHGRHFFHARYFCGTHWLGRHGLSGLSEIS